MGKLEVQIRCKVPGEATGIITRNSFCDVCPPGPNCGAICYVKDGKILKIESMEAHPTSRGLCQCLPVFAPVPPAH